MTDDRESFKVARIAGKAKHHEQRLENATYTAAEVKVLTEKAGEFGRRLGRQEAGDEIADLLNSEVPEGCCHECGLDRRDLAERIRDIGKGDPTT